jgi:5-methylthioadenosine/S-adenosylhomocysteine deaminase
MVQLLFAKYVLPITGDPIENGGIAVNKTAIAAVDTRENLLAAYPQAAVEDFADAAILPGLVNCHTHLEVTSMRGALDDVEHDFTAWLLKLTAIRSRLSDEEISEWAFNGALEAAAAGVTCLGDIGRFGEAGLNALRSAGLRGILFQETEFSPNSEHAGYDFEQLRNKYLKLRDSETELVKVGLSPHSPYTVSRGLFERIAEFAVAEGIPVSIHAAESSDEHEFMTSGGGFFREHYEKFGVNWESPRCSSIGYLEQTGILETKPLLAHCITVSDADIGIIAATGTPIAHCPKSNAKFGHGYAPLERFLDAGIAVGLGSDSVASNNTCDMLEESRFAALAARNRPGSQRFLTAKQMLETATLGGAKALGLDDSVGSIEPGKQADLTVVSMADVAQRPIADVHTALVFASGARDVLWTMVAGNEVFRRTH